MSKNRQTDTTRNTPGES